MTPNLLRTALCLGAALFAGCGAGADAGFITDPQGCAENALRRRGDPAILPDAAAALARDCDMGDAPSCSIAGVMYELGRGAPRDLGRARSLYGRACHVGNARACANLAELLLVDQHAPARALSMLVSACEGGVGRACVTLGRAYQDGALVAASPARARGLYERACGQGEAAGCRALAVILGASGDAADTDRARELLVVACTRGDDEACDRMARRPVRTAVVR
jgi:TPR repeat protein